MLRLGAYLLAAAGLSTCASAGNTAERVISLVNQKYNGTSKTEFTSQAVGQADFFKLDPAPNATTFDSWYFDAMNPSTNEAVLFNFEVHWPIENGATTSQTLYRVTIFGAFANGTAYSYGVDAENVNITERADKSMRMDFFGGDNEFSWSGTSLLEPRPVYNVTINAPKVGIVGNVLLKGNLAAPHYSCGVDAAGIDEQIVEGVGWANALPDANVTVSLKIHEVTMDFEGYGYHDKTWVDRPFPTSLQSAFWGHARLGPYALVWFHSRSQSGKDTSSEYIVRWEDGHIIAARCVDSPNNTLGWGEGQVWPLLPGTPAPAGMALRWDLGDAGVFVANITSTGVFVDIPYWMVGRGPITGGFEGGETYTDPRAMWTLNQLDPL